MISNMLFYDCFGPLIGLSAVVIPFYFASASTAVFFVQFDLSFLPIFVLRHYLRRHWDLLSLMWFPDVVCPMRLFYRAYVIM